MSTQKLAAAISGQQKSSKIYKCTLVPKRNKMYAILGLPEEIEDSSYILQKPIQAQLETTNMVISENSSYAQKTIFSFYSLVQQRIMLDDKPAGAFQAFSILGAEDEYHRAALMDENGTVPATMGDWEGEDVFVLVSECNVMFTNETCTKVKLEVVLADHSYNGTINYKANDESHSIQFTNGRATIMVARPTGASYTAGVKIYDVVESISYTPLDGGDLYISNGATINDRIIENAPENTPIFTVTEKTE